MKLNLPGKELFAKKQCNSFEEATDGVVDALRRQIKRHKGKLLVKN
ncbi:MAG: HPF/RaiA family ribosome-associated protein [Parvicellaceae bacterium]